MPLDLDPKTVYQLRLHDSDALRQLLDGQPAAVVASIIEAYAAYMRRVDEIAIDGAFVRLAWLHAGLITPAQAGIQEEL